MTYNNFKSSVYTADIEVLLATTPTIVTKHHNIVEFFVFVFRNLTITISKVDTRRTSDKAIILQSCTIDVLPSHRNIVAGKNFKSFR